MDKSERDAELDKLIKRTQVIDTVVRYATGIDARDWALYRTAFCDEIDIDFTSWAGGEPVRSNADDWVAQVRATLSGFDATQHISSNHVVTFEGEEATCVSYMIAHHVLATAMGDNTFTIGGFYRNRLRRVAGDWKIHQCTLTVTWATGNRLLFELAAPRAR